MMHSSHKMALFFLLGTIVANLPSAAAQASSPSQNITTLEAVSSSQPLRDGIEVKSGSATLRITALRDDILRVRIAPTGALPEDSSWAVSAWAAREVGRSAAD